MSRGRQPALRRAWLLPRDAALGLAVEAMSGTDLAVGARITRMLQNRLGDAWKGRALRVVFLSGAAIVARRTGGVPPIYASGIAGDGEQPGEEPRAPNDDETGREIQILPTRCGLNRK